MNEARKKLLIQMESIIGSQCYNSKTQNWGPHGVYQGEGREIRYPITFTDADGEKIKIRSVNYDISAEILSNGHYLTGVTKVHIIRGLEKVLDFLKEEYGFDPKK